MTDDEYRSLYREKRKLQGFCQCKECIDQDMRAVEFAKRYFKSKKKCLTRHVALT